jgi:amino acid transporter
VMADDGYLPRLFVKTHRRTGAPWVSVIACALLWAVCYPLGFERSLFLDVLLTGLSIVLEFWALVALRIREPDLQRPYRVPGEIPGTILLGLAPLALIIAALWRNGSELVGGVNQFVIGAAIVAAGMVSYFLSAMFHRKPA